MDRKLIIMIVAPLALLAGIVLAGWYMNYSMGPTVVEDPGQYQQFMAQWPMPEITAHFPPDLPPGAEAVRMVLDPGGIQGAARVELQLRLPQEAVDDLLRQRGLLPTTSPATQAVQSRGETARATPRPAPLHADPQALRLARITSGENRVVALPAEYQLTDFFAFGDDGSWAHGRLYGTAVNRATRHLIYFAQAW